MMEVYSGRRSGDIFGKVTGFAYKHEALLCRPQFIESKVNTRFLEKTEDWFVHGYRKGEGKASKVDFALLTALGLDNTSVKD